MTILEELKRQFATEIDAVIPDAAVALMDDSLGGGAWANHRAQMVTRFHTQYGQPLVTAAMAGLNDERVSLLLAQEYDRAKQIQVKFPTSSADQFFKSVVNQLFIGAVQEVIGVRLDRWHTLMVQDDE